MSRWMLLAVLVLSVSSLVGCGPSPQARLTGKWAGTLTIDQAALDKKIAEQENPAAASLMSQFYKGIASGATLDVEFAADGKMETRLRVPPLVDQKQSGTWAVKSAEGDKITLTLVEGGNSREETIVLTENGFTMDAPGEAAGIAKVVFKKV